MAQWEARQWPANFTAPTQRDRRGGTYRVYVPDRLGNRALAVAGDVSALAAAVEAEVRGLADAPGSRGLEGLARFLLRSEAIASSRIEGLEVSPQQVGIAELLVQEHQSVRNNTARRVAANIAVVRQATLQVTAQERFDVNDLAALQRTLLDDEPRLHGVRDLQNWVGGSDYHPLDAEFVPPSPAHVPALLDDLVGYMNGGEHAALVQSGLVHAQFETIHPFRDGNGRVGRALIHAVLVRRGLTRTAVLPISLVLLTRSHEYIDGLTAYRYDGPPDGERSQAGVSQWLRVYLLAARRAVVEARSFAERLEVLREGWADALAELRTARGQRPAPRADSATARVLADLQENPVLTAASAARVYSASPGPAKQALDELADARVLQRRRVERTTLYLCPDVFDLLALTERALASTRWDTRESPPHRAVPYRPVG